MMSREAVIDDIYLKVSLYNHGEVSVVCLRNILLVLTQLDGDNVTQVRTRVVPETMKYEINNFRDQWEQTWSQP